MESTDSIGATLRRLRQKNHLGLKSAAPKVGISYTHLSRVENGQKKPSPGLIHQLCELYGEDPDNLVAMQGELPDDVKEIVREHGKEALDLLRETFR